ncbi:MAG: hypothetical protein ACXWDJ_10525, partial [Aeromicrobium sp.]
MTETTVDPRRFLPGRVTARQVDVALELLIIAAVGSALASWWLGDRWNGWLTAAHGISGFTIALLIPAKLRGSVRSGLRRGRPSRWLSIAFGVLVLATLALGISHATGVWFGIGQWSPLWTHELFGFVVIPLLVWHVLSRPGRPKLTDVDRRAFLRLGTIAAAGVGVYLLQDVATRTVGLAGGRRRHTGSHEVASFDPVGMPTVVWLNDRRPADVDPQHWDLRVEGRAVSIDELWERSRPVVATLDCTGGWWSEQSWNAVRLDELLNDPTRRSVCVRSHTGYSRLFPIGDITTLHL